VRLVNGLLVAYMKLPPFIVTLGTWQIFWPLNFSIRPTRRSARRTSRRRRRSCNSSARRSIPVGGRGFTYGVIAMVLLVAVLWYVLNHTAWGRHVYAVGDDPEAPKLPASAPTGAASGLHARRPDLRHRAWVLIGRIGSVADQAGQFANIESITAVVIGGISLFGGRGSILGMLLRRADRRRVLAGPALSGHRPAMEFADRRADHRRRRGRPVDQKGSRDDHDNPSSRRAAWSSATAASPRSTMPTSTSMPGEILAVIGDNGAGKSS
jgi:hypothetical protein